MIDTWKHMMCSESIRGNPTKYRRCRYGGIGVLASEMNHTDDKRRLRCVFGWPEKYRRKKYPKEKCRKNDEEQCRREKHRSGKMSNK